MTDRSVPMADAITALDALAVLAGVPNPGRTVELPPDVVQPPTDPDATRADFALYALRRCAAWADALITAATCERCGARLERGTARLCFGGGESGVLQLPGTCPSRECREARDAAALADAIARGVVDP